VIWVETCFTIGSLQMMHETASRPRNLFLYSDPSEEPSGKKTNATLDQAHQLFYFDFDGDFSGEVGLQDAAGEDFVGGDTGAAAAPGTLLCIPAAASLPCNQV
jgi:hypothetical protein